MSLRPLLLLPLVSGLCACGAPAAPPVVGATTLPAVQEPLSWPRADVVLISVDTWRSDRLGVLGGPFETTPQLRHWVERGGFSILTAGRSDASWTYPTMASVATGLRPVEHGGVAHEHAIPQGVETLAERFASAGYATGFFGANFIFEWRFGLDQGFQHYFADAEKSAGELILLADEWLAGVDDERPVFLHLHFFEPHCPFLATEAVDADWKARHPRRWYRSRATISDDLFPTLGGCFDLHSDGETGRELRSIRDYHRAYDAELAELDASLVVLQGMLRSHERWDESAIVLMGDHGEEFLDHGDFGHGRTLYEEQVRVPMAVRLPLGVSGGRRIDTPALTSDWYPTLLGLAGLATEVPDAVDLRPVLAGGALPQRPIDLATSYEGELRAAVEGEWKVIVNLATGQRELFHLPSDPLEQNDRAPQEAERAEQMARALLERDAAAALRGRALGAVPLPLTDEAREQLQSWGYLQ